MSLATEDAGIYFRHHVRQSNIQLSNYRNSVKTRLRCSLLNGAYTLQVLQQNANQRL